MSEIITVRVPLSIRRTGGRKAIVVPSGTLPVPARLDVTLVKAVARGFRWRRLLESGRYNTISELAAAEKITGSYISRLLQLTLLAPELVEAILDGRQPEAATLVRLTRPLSAVWNKQCAQLRNSTQYSAGADDEPHYLHGR